MDHRSPFELPPKPAAGQVVAGRYKLLEQIGRGGMGRVFRAEHIELGRTVAIKILEPLSDVQNAAKRFLREAKSTANLHHDNIVQVLDFGQTEHGAPFIVMEFLDGRDLATILRTEGPLAWPRVHRLIDQLAAGLIKAHEAGLVHRDLKLENCLVVEQDVLKIVDFGTAKTSNPDATRLTGAGAIIGTPIYMSPEQARGEEVDLRADVYAVGIIAYQLLTGAPPFIAKSFMDVLMKHIHDPVPPPSSRNAGIPPSVDQLLLKALAKDRDERFPHMSAFRDALHTIDPNTFGPPSISAVTPIPTSVVHTAPIQTASQPTVPVSKGGFVWIVVATALVVVVAAAVLVAVLR